MYIQFLGYKLKAFLAATVAAQKYESIFPSDDIKVSGIKHKIIFS